MADATRPGTARGPFAVPIRRSTLSPPAHGAGARGEGLLDQEIENAAERTVAAECSLMQQGVPSWQAQERMREEWAFLPCEEDVPARPNGNRETRGP
jgi:hypothetical protein